MTSSDGLYRRPGRRAVLLLTGLGIGAVLTACTDPASGPAPTGSATPTPPSPDELAAGRAVFAARTLLAEEAALAGSPRFTAVVAAAAAAHRAHLAALGLPDLASSGLASASSGPGSPSASASASRPVAAPNPAAVVALERAAAVEALSDVAGTTPGTAGLLARIAAARAVHADRFATAAGAPTPGEFTIPPPTTPTPTSPTDSPGTSPTGGSPTASPTVSSMVPTEMSPSGASLDGASAAALAALLSGEHAAVFAYGLITARAPDARKALARAWWEEHRGRRDELERRLLAAGRSPVAAEPAYDVGRPPTTPAQLSALAARVEDGLAAVALGAVTGAGGAVRAEAAMDLVRAARRAAAWRGTGVALPGGPA